jgi:hypothetical protein
MKLVLLILKLLGLCLLGYLLIFILTTEGPAAGGYRPPFILWILDTINLFIHEAGHFFTRPFGQFIYILGGSLVQCLIPLAMIIATWRQNVGQIVWPGFWLGENMVNVSYYIQDAPYKQLKLIAKGLIHDWNWILSGNEDLAEPLGATVWWGGIIVCVVSIGAGVWFAVQEFREDTGELPSPTLLD